MTEQQFSKEYIDYILKAKALQQGREFGIGDWYIPCPERPEPRLIKNRLDMASYHDDTGELFLALHPWVGDGEKVPEQVQERASPSAH